LDTDFHDPVLEFPTITVCPLEPFNETKVNFVALSKVSNYDETMLERNAILLQNITSLSYDNLKEFVEYYNKYKFNIESWKKKSLREWAFAIAADVDEIFFSCKFRAATINCGELFHTVYSEKGLCFSFNPRYHGVDE
jgi:Amiloride-sensitive sodium channel